MTHPRLNNIIGFYTKRGYSIETAGGKVLFSMDYGADAPVLFKIKAQARARAKEIARELVVKVAGIQFRK